MATHLPAPAPSTLPAVIHTPRTELDTLADRITELAAHIDAAQYQLLVLIERFDREEGWAWLGVRSCAHWLSWRCGMGLGAARERVRVARALPELPKISRAFRKGTISYSKVRAMTRVATPANEESLLNVARHGTASHVERLSRAYRRVGRSIALELEQHRHFRRTFRCWQDDDDSWVIKARLTPEQGALLERALDLADQQLFAERRNEPAEVSAETPEAPLDLQAPEDGECRRADALARVLEAFLAGGGHPEEETTLAAGAAHDDIEAVEHAGEWVGSRNPGWMQNEAPSRPSRPALNGGDRCCVHLHCTPETLKADGEDDLAELEITPGRNASVSAETSRRLSCDAGLVAWQKDADGKTLNIGRKSRTVPPAIRRALQRRDVGCRFPGCSCTRWVDAHHVIHWADGGPTKLDNLVLLCRFHHRKVHEEGFGVHMRDGQPVFTLPSGTVIPPVAETRFRGNAIELRRRNRAIGLDITPETPIPRWHGETMDLNQAVQGLVYSDHGRYDVP